MNLEEAKTLLGGAVRHELRDHAFGDSEVYWVKDGKEIACGYFGGGRAEVSIFKPASDATNFDGDNARALRDCGSDLCVQRNDETGPEQYAEGVTMAGLILDSVREELTS